jgi:hypothetical protein
MFILKTNLFRGNLRIIFDKLYHFTVWDFITISLATKSSVCRADISMSLLDDNINRPSFADRLTKKRKFKIILWIFFLFTLNSYLN